jgi:hypothetical protein
MKRYIKLLLTCLALVGISLYIGTLGVHSQSENGDITIDPVYQQVIVKPSPDTQQFSFKITNHTKSAQTFSLKAVDFGSLNDTGGVAFIGVKTPDLNYKYALSPWIKVENKSIVVGPGQTLKQSVLITDVHSMPPGGHYGAIFIQPQKSNEQGQSSKVEVSQVVSSLVFVNKVGGDVYKLDLESNKSNQSLFKLPSKVTLRFHNGGNIHLVPRGKITINDSKGRIIREGLVNEDSGIMLPESNRQFVSIMQNRAMSWLPGNYYLNVKFRYDGKDSYTVKTIKFFYFGKVLIYVLPILIVLGLIVFFIVKKSMWKKLKA